MIPNFISIVLNKLTLTPVELNKCTGTYRRTINLGFNLISLI